MRKLLALAALGWLMLPSVAKADLFFTLNLTTSSVCCGAAPFGSVDLQQFDADTVQVTETLTAGNFFLGNPSPESSLSFNVDKSISFVAGTLTNGFISGGANTTVAYGNFGFFVSCINTVCGDGTAIPQFSGPLTFQVSNVSGLLLSDFVANSPGGYYFASDIFGPPIGEFPKVGSVANNGPDGGTVPEPGSVLLLATAAGISLWTVRKRRAA